MDEPFVAIWEYGDKRSDFRTAKELWTYIDLCESLGGLIYGGFRQWREAEMHPGHEIAW